MKLPPLIRGQLIKRYKRFLADILLEGGELITAHVANPGAMTGLAAPGSEVYLSQSDDPRRKLRHSWELVRAGRALVCVNTARANPLVEEALRSGAIAELAGFSALRREVPYGDSRLDFELLFDDAQRPTPGAANDALRSLAHNVRTTDDSTPPTRCLVEVKQVTLDLGDGESGFPDTVTQRGARHLRELISARRAGHRAVLLFCSGRGDTRAVRPAAHIDQAYAEGLREAHAAGVEVLAYAGRVTQRALTLTHRVPVRW